MISAIVFFICSTMYLSDPTHVFVNPYSEPSDRVSLERCQQIEPEPVTRFSVMNYHVERLLENAKKGLPAEYTDDNGVEYGFSEKILTHISKYKKYYYNNLFKNPDNHWYEFVAIMARKTDGRPYVILNDLTAARYARPKPVIAMPLKDFEAVWEDQDGNIHRRSQKRASIYPKYP